MAKIVSNGANLGFEWKLWQAGYKMKRNMDASEHTQVVLGLIFLKYISDAFKEVYEDLKKNKTADPEDVGEYVARRVFWVPKEARWEYLQKNAKSPEIGELIDNAMDYIERDNRLLKGVLPKNYASPDLDKQRLGELVELIGTIGLSDKKNKNNDVLGRVYEYFIDQFVGEYGKKGGQFYTPRSIVKLLVEMVEPYKGIIFDPCCGSGGMFVQSEKFVEAHGGRVWDISIYGQESNQTSWRLCKMNLAIRGMVANIGWGDSFRDDQFKDVRADFVLANPPFNDFDWGGELLQDDVRWVYGVPPKGNANFAWVQHFIYHLSPTGTAGFVLANGSLSSMTSNEGEIRKNIVEADLVDCIVALPSQLFYNTMIPVSLWFVSRNKKNNKFKDRSGKVLFIDARKFGVMVDRKHRELTDEEIKKIADTYHAWKGETKLQYKDVPGFCKSATLEEIRKHQHILTPGRYVGLEEVEEDTEVFEEKMKRLIAELSEQMQESKRLDEEIKKNLKMLGWEVK